MTGMQYMNDLNAANVLRQLWEKLPRYLRSKWTERASKIRSTNQQVVSFNDFSEFVSQQPDLTTDPVYSEDSISRIQLTSNISRANASLRQEGVQISQKTCRQKRPLNETLFPSAVPCAQRHTTWMNVPSSLRNPSKTEETSLRRRAYVLVAAVPTTLPSFAEINDPVRPATRDTRRHFMVTTGGQKERTPNIRNQKWERKTKLSMRTPQSAM